MSMCVFDVKFIYQLEKKKKQIEKGLSTWKLVANFHGNSNEINMKLALQRDAEKIGFSARDNKFFAHTTSTTASFSFRRSVSLFK